MKLVILFFMFSLRALAQDFTDVPQLPQTLRFQKVEAAVLIHLESNSEPTYYPARYWVEVECFPGEKAHFHPIDSRKDEVTEGAPRPLICDYTGTDYDEKTGNIRFHYMLIGKESGPADCTRPQGISFNVDQLKAEYCGRKKKR